MAEATNQSQKSLMYSFAEVRKKLGEAGVKGFIVTNWAQGYMVPLEPATLVRGTIAEQDVPHGTSAAQAIRILSEAAEAS